MGNAAVSEPIGPELPQLFISQLAGLVVSELSGRTVGHHSKAGLPIGIQPYGSRCRKRPHKMRQTYRAEGLTGVLHHFAWEALG